MLYKMEARNSRGAVLELSLEDISDGFALLDVDGLDPVDASISSSDFAQQDGAEFESARRIPRNLTAKISLEPQDSSQTVRGLRRILYSFFMPKKEVKLRFFDTDGLTVDISGYVESLKSKFFSKEPSVDISIMCLKPDLIEIESSGFSGDTTDTTDEVPIVYEGSIETGLKFTLYVDRTISELTIYMRGPDDVVKSMDIAIPMESGDILEISTVPGDKYATLNHLGTISYVAYAVSPQSTWHKLFEGDNNIRVYAEGDPIPYDISYITRHGGL